MKTATVSDFRAKMKERLHEIMEDQDILILSGPKKMDFVVLTLDAYNSMEETAHLTSSQKNAERLLESMAQDKAGDASVRKINIGKFPASATKRTVKSGTGKTKGRKRIGTRR